MKRIIDVDENLICEGFVRNFTEEEKDVLINAIRYSIPIDNVANAEETEDYIINQEENCNIVCDFIRDITGIDIRKEKKHERIQDNLADEVWKLYEKYQPRLATSVIEFGDELKELLGKYQEGGAE